MLTVINPATGEQLHAYPTLVEAQIEQSLQNAVSAYEYWKTVSFQERADALFAVAEVMQADRERLALLMTDEMGKPIKEARAEVDKAVWCAQHYAEHAAQYLSSQTLASDAHHSYVQHLPVGPLLGILPWNAPFWLAFRFCAPALMAGNTCLLKHDPHVPACAAAIAEVFVKAGVPSGLLQNLPLANEQIAGVIQDFRVRGVSFTGSGKAGGVVAGLAGASLKPCVLELGGSDPSIVLADADLDQAADVLVLSRMINAGQSCIAAKRLIVEAPVYEAFIERLKVRIEALTLGNPRDEATDIGPLARADLRDNLARQVEATLEAGARCLVGGLPDTGAGYYYPPTLLVDVTNDMAACQEETFGPVAVVVKADNAEHALAIANDTRYGLAASVWTGSSNAEAMAKRLETGQVAINGIVKTDPRLPSGGIKNSGIGRELGPHGILAFVNVQQVWVGPKQG
ncbi:NAD-dependent succinate-semialdehyde dehydrogenase [Aestuariicella hydrocarbonica]|uniref:NAD-dependent succinate-semialdehyde dehydrogenase n=1 Tax=Pseudomaricurvus hydrocarbonicus TaxID=1470433 RepID=A0A9E5T4L2_9GAMM|nr:NAD-dependent succinate-semialdehyde dehydrogenase [Aestuariicella hydrocarbonica]NHO68074.1 NAD-dependent succinate-semialdehyde dehydrogenase [Aestuariicella hydrocarbonica]